LNLTNAKHFEGFSLIIGYDTCGCLHQPRSLKCKPLKKNCIEGQGRWLVQYATGNCGKCTVGWYVDGTFSIAENRIWCIWEVK